MQTDAWQTKCCGGKAVIQHEALLPIAPYTLGKDKNSAVIYSLKT